MSDDQKQCVYDVTPCTNCCTSCEYSDRHEAKKNLTKINFTPGPWKYFGDGRIYTAMAKKYDEVICEVNMRDNESLENVRLIVSAPLLLIENELLKAELESETKWAKKYHEECEKLKDIVRKLTDTLKKSVRKDKSGVFDDEARFFIEQIKLGEGV